MPELKWSEYDFVECLGVLPKIDEYETGHHFRVEKNDLILVVSIWQYDCLFQILLYQSNKEKPFISFYLSVRDEVKFVNDSRGFYLSFQNCAVVSSNFPPTESAKFSSNEDSESINMELEVEPELNIRFVR